MKITNVVRAVAVLCSVFSVNASDSISFQFSDEGNDGFRASAQYCAGYNCMNTYADDMSDLAQRVSGISNGAVSFNNSHRGTYELSGCYPYSMKKNNMEFYELLTFDGMKYSNNVGRMIFSGTDRYQPSVKLSFDSVSDMNLPDIECNNIPLMRFEARNNTNGSGILRNFKTNGVTGLSYNVPLYIRGCQCNNIQGDFRNLCVLASANGNNNTCADFKRYNGEPVDLGGIQYLKITGLEGKFGTGVKIKSIKSYRDLPAGVIKTYDAHAMKNLNEIRPMNQSGKIAFKFTGNVQANRWTPILNFGVKGYWKRNANLQHELYDSIYSEDKHPTTQNPAFLVFDLVKE